MLKNKLILFLAVICVSCSKDNDISTQSTQTTSAMAEANMVSDRMSNVFLEASTVKEMSTHIEDIKAMEEVETAWAESDCVYARLKNGLTVGWFFPMKESPSETMARTTRMAVLDSILVTSATRAPSDGAPNHSAAMKVCIINQTCNDIRHKEATEYLKGTATTFRNYGYEVDEKNGADFNLTFIREEMANYNLVLLHTHGAYTTLWESIESIFHDPNVHWIFTGQEPTKLDIAEEDKKNTYIVNHKEIDDKGREIEHRYVGVSELWLKSNLGKFPDQSMLFASVCHSMEGHDGLWEAFQANNLGCFFGFDNTVPEEWGTMKSFDMLASLMVLGSTVKGAHSLLDDKYKKHNFYYNEETHEVTTANIDDGDARHVELEVRYRDSKYDMSICDAVDLGLSVMWGTRNLGAKTPFELGNFYKWGITEPIGENEKQDYNYTLDFSNGEYYDISGNSLHDPATKELGEGWRLPTMGEIVELVNLTQSYSAQSGKMAFYDEWVSGSMGGQLIISSVKYAEGKSACIFLPYYWNSSGHYMSGWLIPDSELEAWELMYMDPLSYQYTLNVGIPGTTGERGKISTSHVQRSWMCSVRPVYGKKKL